jgi:hypothetical protein
MIHAYRLVYPFNQPAPPPLWEFEEPYIHHLMLNARNFNRRLTQWDFEDVHALDRDNTQIWDTYYRAKPLYHAWKTWQEWLPAYRQLIIDVQDIYEAHKAQGTWRRPG